MTDRRTIHLVDDEEAIRKSTGFMLRTSGFAVETYASGVAFLKVMQGAEPGCILLDVRMPEMDGLEVQDVLRERGVTWPVIVLTGHGDVSIAIRAMKGGAVDFIEKPFEKLALLAAISNAMARLDKADKRLDQAAEAELRIAALTDRERDVLQELARGHPNKTIAYDLDISPRTVEVHRANLMSKLGVRSFADVLRLAFAAGLPRDP
ncbi:response regulator transcription factor [Sphingomonas abietis]|uniref:Response regulator transcription factor n=1 Tax=Sphingomonas abietis TaxID=3012344 RepID=A0ABY7NS88_9SPHN|nr:response regulator transcription factor [Sphingomonas abietis]WBO24409.1 response regulator transcription factor [Sphingomonas abietis]